MNYLELFGYMMVLKNIYSEVLKKRLCYKYKFFMNKLVVNLLN